MAGGIRQKCHMSKMSPQNHPVVYLYNMEPQERISDLNDKLKVLRTKLSVTEIPEQKSNLQDKIKVINYRIEIEQIKKLIQDIESR
jgi:heterodisulfide reductase subunit C